MFTNQIKPYSQTMKVSKDLWMDKGHYLFNLQNCIKQKTNEYGVFSLFVNGGFILYIYLVSYWLRQF